MTPSADQFGTCEGFPTLKHKKQLECINWRPVEAPRGEAERKLRSRIALKYGQGRGILLSREDTAELYKLLKAEG
jgi:hypothetical protein